MESCRVISKAAVGARAGSSDLTALLLSDDPDQELDEEAQRLAASFRSSAMGSHVASVPGPHGAQPAGGDSQSVCGPSQGHANYVTYMSAPQAPQHASSGPAQHGRFPAAHSCSIPAACSAAGFWPPFPPDPLPHQAPRINQGPQPCIPPASAYASSSRVCTAAVAAGRCSNAGNLYRHKVLQIYTLTAFLEDIASWLDKKCPGQFAAQLQQLIDVAKTNKQTATELASNKTDAKMGNVIKSWNRHSSSRMEQGRAPPKMQQQVVRSPQTSHVLNLRSEIWRSETFVSRRWRGCTAGARVWPP
ncbi:hypothetical protein WJX74_002612 [Apatococcus lobatus]|uniref:Uncharacterized protein n=1 Tax=Apatococcus lobatus TaxID=904363 RepID=A0AAW1Q509_9CHLO